MFLFSNQRTGVSWTTRQADPTVQRSLAGRRPLSPQGARHPPPDGIPLKTFDQLDLIEPLRRAVAAQNYTHPTPIQEQAIPLLLDGRDVLGCAQTGTGKTAAFTLPVLQHITARPSDHRGRRPIRALVLTPTRELAAQIGASVEAYGAHLRVRHTVIFGGVKQGSQVRALQRGIDVLVATPGRLLDLIGQGYVDLGAVEFFVLDEADRMLDMGFIHDVRRVLAELPARRQNLLFSATMPPSIVKLASSFLHQPARVEVTPESSTVEKVRQSVMFCAKTDKRRLLAWLIREQGVDSAIVFTRTKHGANRLVKQLGQANIEAAAIHGNKSQNARTRALDSFRRGELRILVATDIAARGIDVDGVSHVFNFDLPNEPESYVHRIGRTARAGREGVAIAFCDDSEGDYLRDIERLIGQVIPVDPDHEWHDGSLIPPPARTFGGRRGSAPKRGKAPPTSKPRRDRPPRRNGKKPGAESQAQPNSRRPQKPKASTQGDGEQRRRPQKPKATTQGDGEQRRRRRWRGKPKS